MSSPRRPQTARAKRSGQPALHPGRRAPGALRGTPLGRDVRDALVHLNDPPYLETSPLTYLVSGEAARAGTGLSQALRGRLLEAIDALQPEPDLPPRAAAPGRLRYRLLYLRYVQAEEVGNICTELAISQRKYYVEHVLGVKAIISRLTSGRRPEGTPELSGLPVRGAASWPGPRTLVLQPGNPFVGRHNELARMTSLYETVAAQQRGWLVLITGEAGAGKSRLALTFAGYAAGRGATVLEGRYGGGSEAPHAPWADILRAGLGDTPLQERARTMAGLMADLFRHFPELAPGGSGRPVRLSARSEEQQARLYDSVAEALAPLAARGPLVLVVDDLHRAPGLAMFSHVVRRLAHHPVLVVGAYRPEEVVEGSVVAHELGALEETEACVTMKLRAFSEAETAQVLAATFGDEAASILGPAVYGTTRGNAFFIEETMRSLVERRVVWPGETGWECVDPHAVTVPDSVVRSVGERVSRLGPQAQQLLARAAVLGQEFSLQVLAHLAGLEDPILWHEAERAVAAGLLVDRSLPGDDRYAFADPRVQEVLHQDMGEEERRRYHGEAAAILEEHYGNTRHEHANELAEHLAFSADAADRVRAIAYLRSAARWAAGLYAYPRAAAALERALELERQLPPDPARRCDLLLDLGEVLGPGGDPARVAGAVAVEALELAEALHDEERAARACRAGLDAMFRFGSRLAPSTGQYRGWVEGAQRHTAPGSRERVYANIAAAWVQWDHGRLAAAHEGFAAAWDQARALGDPQAQLQVAAILLSVSPAPRHFAWLSDVAEEVIALPRQDVPARVLGTALQHAANNLLQRGQRDRAAALWQAIGDLASRTRDPYLQLYLFGHEIMASLLGGRLERAVEAGRDMVAHADRWGMPAVGRFILASLTARPLLLLGAADEALVFLQRHVEPRAEPREAIAELQCFEPLCLANLGRREDAAAALDRVFAQVVDALSSRLAPAAPAALLLEAAVQLADTEKAAALVACLEESDAVCPGPAFLSLDRLLGDGFMLLGAAGRARRRYQRGLERCVALDLQPEIALIHLRLARLLREGYARERAAALAHLEAAAAAFREMGMAPALTEALQLYEKWWKNRGNSAANLS